MHVYLEETDICTLVKETAEAREAGVTDSCLVSVLGNDPGPLETNPKSFGELSHLSSL